MTFSEAAIKAFLIKYIAKPLGGPATLIGASAVPMLSMAQTLLELVHCGLATDVGRVKESIIRMIEARADGKDADNLKKVAEAAEAHNKAELVKRQRAIATAAAEQRRADAAKTMAEADSIRVDAETRRATAAADARLKLIEAVSRIRQQGGDIVFSEANLREILGLGPAESKPDEPE